MKLWHILKSTASALIILSGIPTAAMAASVGPKIDFIDPIAGSEIARGGNNLSPVGMFMTADTVVQAVILLLLAASVVTWTIGVAKWVELKRERRLLEGALPRLAGATDLSAIGETGFAPLSEMIVHAEDEIAASERLGAMPGEGIKDRIALRLDRLEAGSRRRLGRGIGILAIIGSSAPFVGLFGTVWGIMNSFIGIAQSHTTNLAVVAPGIAEALLTTGVGLMAAIPAGILYNIFARALSVYTGELADAGATILCLAAREVDHAGAGS